MRIERAYTMANKGRLQFLEMERSLRASGFDLPPVVFPYDENTFDLPKGSEWLHTPLHRWLTSKKVHLMCSKYYCLTQNSYTSPMPISFTFAILGKRYRKWTVLVADTE